MPFSAGQPFEFADRNHANLALHQARGLERGWCRRTAGDMVGGMQGRFEGIRARLETTRFLPMRAAV